MKEFIVRQQIRTSKELELMKTFLRANHLPADDLLLENSCLLIYFNGDDEVMGTGGLEYYGQHALLRSLAVSQGLRGQQLGKQIVADLLEQARLSNIKEVYLMTETAFFFFQKLGFKEVQRENVPAPIQASSEFSYTCPASAQVMKLVVHP